MANAEASQKDPWILRWKDPDRCRGRIVESVEPPLDVPWIFGAHHFNIYVYIYTCWNIFSNTVRLIPPFSVYIHTYHLCWSKKTHLTLSRHMFFQPVNPAQYHRMKSLRMMSLRWRMVWILQASCRLCSGCQIAAGRICRCWGKTTTFSQHFPRKDFLNMWCGFFLRNAIFLFNMD